MRAGLVYVDTKAASSAASPDGDAAINEKLLGAAAGCLVHLDDRLMCRARLRPAKKPPKPCGSAQLVHAFLNLANVLDVGPRGRGRRRGSGRELSASADRSAPTTLDRAAHALLAWAGPSRQTWASFRRGWSMHQKTGRHWCYPKEKATV